MAINLIIVKNKFFPTINLGLVLTLILLQDNPHIYIISNNRQEIHNIYRINFLLI